MALTDPSGCRGLGLRLEPLESGAAWPWQVDGAVSGVRVFGHRTHRTGLRVKGMQQTPHPRWPHSPGSLSCQLTTGQLTTGPHNRPKGLLVKEIMKLLRSAG